MAVVTRAQQESACLAQDDWFLGWDDDWNYEFTVMDFEYVNDYIVVGAQSTETTSPGTFLSVIDASQSSGIQIVDSFMIDSITIGSTAHIVDKIYQVKFSDNNRLTRALFGVFAISGSDDILLLQYKYGNLSAKLQFLKFANPDMKTTSTGSPIQIG